MKAGDLKAITLTARSCPEILPHLIFIYQLAYKQGIIDYLKEEKRKVLETL